MRCTVFITSLLLSQLFGSAQNEQWKLVWSDNFNNRGLPDTSKWNYDIGNINGWGNNELQYYTNDIHNAQVTKGNLVLSALRQQKDGFRYTSAKLVTRGKASWQYGKVEVRAKLPTGMGSWPAIWMLPDNIKIWPDDGEIDIMEHVGFDPGWVHGSIHCKQYNHVIGTQKTAKKYVKNFSKKFHIYTTTWDKDCLTISIDGAKFFSFKNEHKGYEYWPFDNKMYLILNIAVGGNWGGQQGVDDKSFPMKMEIDFVRVYQKEL